MKTCSEGSAWMPPRLRRFVTRDELRAVGMNHLVGTSLLRAYMHGFFVHNKLWQKAKAIASPLDYTTVRKERIQSKLEAERAQRITLKRKLPKVSMCKVEAGLPLGCLFLEGPPHAARRSRAAGQCYAGC